MDVAPLEDKETQLEQGQGLDIKRSEDGQKQRQKHGWIGSAMGTSLFSPLRLVVFVKTYQDAWLQVSIRTS